MENNDYILFMTDYRAKLVTLMGLLYQNPVKYESKILQTEAMIRVVDIFKQEYLNSILAPLNETTFMPEIESRWTRKEHS